MSLLKWLKNDQSDSQRSFQDDVQLPEDVVEQNEPDISPFFEVDQPEATSDSEVEQDSQGHVDSEDSDDVQESAQPQCSQALIPNKANQPFLSFPKRAFGKQYRAFSPSWYKHYSWLHYQEGSDKVLCFYCHVAELQHLPVKHKDKVFSTTGFSNWKKALSKFQKHQCSVAHHEAVNLIQTLPSTHKDVGEMLSSTHAKQKSENRKMLLYILRTIRILGRQGLPLRGKYQSGEERGELDSNFIQFLKDHAEDDPTLNKWMEKSQDKFTSPDIQNELLSIMALKILCDICQEISGKWYTIMVDETTDLANTEQMVFCLRYVNDSLQVHEEVIGLHSMESTSAESIVATIKDILLCMDLKMDNCRGQCYDGASNMSGVRSGVATRISAIESRALYTHCYGHALNLATQDTLKGIKVMECTLDTVYEITKLIKKSPKREVIFKNIKDEFAWGSPGIRILCPTRWTVRAESLASISENYEALQLAWEAAREATKDTEARARIGGVAAQMEKFEFFFGVELSRKLLSMVDNLSRSLQAQKMSACEGQHLVGITLKALQKIRSEENFDLFWKYVDLRRSSLDVSDPSLPRKRKVPRRFEMGEAAPEHSLTAKDHYRRIYFQAIDLIVSTIESRFEQRGFQMLKKLETLLTTVDSSLRSELLKEVVEFYHSDFGNENLVQTQLTLLHANSTEESSLEDLQSVITYLETLTSVQKEFYSEVIKIVKLILVMPATNAVSERSFSALRRLKTWLRTTMTQTRLNWCMVLHIHKERTDSLSLASIGNEFVSRNNSRKKIFGHF